MWPISRTKLQNSKELSYFIDRIKLLEESHSHIIVSVASKTGDLLYNIVVSPLNIRILLKESCDKYLTGFDVLDKKLTKLLLENNRMLNVTVSQGAFRGKLLLEGKSQDTSYNAGIEGVLEKSFKDVKFGFGKHEDVINVVTFPGKGYEDDKRFAGKVSTGLSDKLGISTHPVYSNKKTWEVHIYYGETKNENYDAEYGEHSYGGGM